MEDSRNPYEPAYDFTQWDADQFKRAGEVLANLAQRRDGVTSMRRAVLALYFQDLGEEGHYDTRR